MLNSFETQMALTFAEHMNCTEALELFTDYVEYAYPFDESQREGTLAQLTRAYDDTILNRLCTGCHNARRFCECTDGRIWLTINGK
jgi:hypothetical protein